MNSKISAAACLVLFLQLGTGCSDIRGLSSTESIDSTVLTTYPEAVSSGVSLLSAFYGLDDAIPLFASYLICGRLGLQDGMPVIFSKEIDLSTMQSGDFIVNLTNGQKRNVACATPAPARDSGELRTILLVGDFGSIDNQPVSVEIVGNIISLDHQSNFKDSVVKVTQLERGPYLIHAEFVKESQWELGKEATPLPFGGGSGCPASTRQVIRAIWTGGVTKPGGDEIDDLERLSYRVFVEDEGKKITEITPFAIGDLGDGDNNHELCLDVDARVVRVEFPQKLLTDPREDLNPATSISISY